MSGLNFLNIYVPIILIGVLLAITLILILADRAMGIGEKKLTINNEKEFPVAGDDTVLNTLNNRQIFIPSACGGKATCGFCKVRIIEGGGEIKPTEEPFLSKEEREQGMRLSCQVKVRENMHIELPSGLLTAKEFKGKVSEIKDLTYDIKQVRFDLQEPAEIDFKPGQYVQIKVPGIEVVRAYSIASSPEEHHMIELIIRMVPKGQATSFVHQALQLGDKVAITGPFGDFFLREDSSRDMVCIAGGSGKAPIRSILSFLKERGMNRKIKYFFGARSKRDLFYTEEFMELSKEFPNFEYIPALSEPLPEDDWTGEVGLITDVVDRLTDDLAEAEAYLCGSPGMIFACIKVLNKHNIKTENVLYDKFS